MSLWVDPEVLAYANTLQTIVFMIMGLVAFVFIIYGLGGLEKAAKVPIRVNENGLVVQDFKFDREKGMLLENETPMVVGKVLDSANPNLTDQQPHFWREPTTIEFKKKNPNRGTYPF